MASESGDFSTHDEDVLQHPLLSSQTKDPHVLAKTLNFSLPIKLQKDNYIAWKTQVLPAIRALDLEDFVIGTIVCPPKFVEVKLDSKETREVINKEFTAWEKVDQMLLCWLLSTISQSITRQLTDCVTTCEVWKVLEKLYTQQSMARILQIMHELQNVKKGYSSISDYVLKVKMLGDSLRAAGQQVNHHGLILNVLSGVGHEYDPVVVLVSSQKNTMTLQEVQYLLMLHEQRIEQLYGGLRLELGSATANLVSSGQSDRRNLIGGYSGRNGDNKSRGRGRNGGRWNSNYGLFCQVCGKPGHTAIQCYHRFDRACQGVNHYAGNSQSNTGYSPPAFGNENSSLPYYAIPNSVNDSS